MKTKPFYFLISILSILLFCTVAYAQEEIQSLDNKASFHYDLVEGGKQLSIQLNNPEIPITKLQMITNDDVEDVTFEFETISEPDVEELDDVYEYVSIEAPKIADDNIRIAILRFKIPKLWFEENDYGKETVMLLRYDEEWKELKAIYEGSDTEHHQYRAQIPGFSYFAIKAAENVAEEPENVVVEQIKTEEEPEKETEEEIETESPLTRFSILISQNGEADPVVGISIVIVIVVLGVALFLFYKGK